MENLFVVTKNLHSATEETPAAINEMLHQKPAPVALYVESANDVISSATMPTVRMI